MRKSQWEERAGRCLEQRLEARAIAACCRAAALQFFRQGGPGGGLAENIVMLWSEVKSHQAMRSNTMTLRRGRPARASICLPREPQGLASTQPALPPPRPHPRGGVWGDQQNRGKGDSLLPHHPLRLVGGGTVPPLHPFPARVWFNVFLEHRIHSLQQRFEAGRKASLEMTGVGSRPLLYKGWPVTATAHPLGLCV